MAQWPYNTVIWQRLRLAKLNAQPLCEACLAASITTPASHVDHVHNINDGGPPFPALNGLASMCQPCHNRKTASADGRGQTIARHYAGHDATGTPLCPHDSWGGAKTLFFQGVRTAGEVSVEFSLGGEKKLPDSGVF